MEELLQYFSKLSTKDKKHYEKYTYHCTTEPIHLKRIRGFKMYLKINKIETIKELYLKNKSQPLKPYTI